MKFLDGLKTILGIAGLVLTPIISVGGKLGELAAHGLAALGPIGQTAEGFFGILVAVGLAHKVVKADLLSRGVPPAP
jgi:hypothetical protein